MYTHIHLPHTQHTCNTHATHMQQDCTPTTYFDDVDDTVVMECTLGYTCECPPGYFGDDCSLLIDHCDPDPCVNVVVCHDLLLGYFCECLPGYTGADCDTEFDYCEEMQPCNNGATCQVRRERK